MSLNSCPFPAACAAGKGLGGWGTAPRMHWPRLWGNLSAPEPRRGRGRLTLGRYPFNPVREIPSINVRWVKKNPMSMGTVATVLTAIRYE